MKHYFFTLIFLLLFPNAVTCGSEKGSSAASSVDTQSNAGVVVVHQTPQVSQALVAAETGSVGSISHSAAKGSLGEQSLSMSHQSDKRAIPYLCCNVNRCTHYTILAGMSGLVGLSSAAVVALLAIMANQSNC